MHLQSLHFIFPVLLAVIAPTVAAEIGQEKAFWPPPRRQTNTGLHQQQFIPLSSASSSILKSKDIDSCTMAKTKNSSAGESTVLRELKETVQKQAKEIDELRKQLKAPQPPPSAAKKVSTQIHGGGHGAPGGDSENIDLYLSKPFYVVAFNRVGWLSLFLCSLSLTAFIMNGFESTLHRQIELAYFVPLLAGHGGNTGGQTVGTVLSALSAGTVSLKDAPRVIAKEALSGLVVGSVVGSALAPISHYLLGISHHVAVVLFCTLPLVSLIASTLGSTIPFACLAMGLDPSLIAAPAMTSFVDVSGLMSYFLIANQVFRFFGVEL